MSHPHIETAAHLRQLTLRLPRLPLASDERYDEAKLPTAQRLQVRPNRYHQVEVTRYTNNDRRRLTQAATDNIPELSQAGLLDGYVSLVSERQEARITADLYVGKLGVFAATDMTFATPGEKKVVRQELADGMRQTYLDAKLFGLDDMWTTALLDTWYEFPPREWRNQAVERQQMLDNHHIEQLNHTLGRLASS